MSAQLEQCERQH
jgi:hypothetical protein